MAIFIAANDPAGIALADIDDSVSIDDVLLYVQYTVTVPSLHYTCDWLTAIVAGIYIYVLL